MDSNPPKLDREITKTIWVVYRENRGCWTEIYRTADEAKARAEAARMQSWDAQTKTVRKRKTFIGDA